MKTLEIKTEAMPLYTLRMDKTYLGILYDSLLLRKCGECGFAKQCTGEYTLCYDLIEAIRGALEEDEKTDLG